MKKKKFGIMDFLVAIISIWAFTALFFLYPDSKGHYPRALSQTSVAESKEKVTPKLPNKDVVQKRSYPRLVIPSIKVDTSVENVGLTKNGAMGVPNGPDKVGWFKNGSRFGEIGSAVISGHSSWSKDVVAVFDNLNKISVGDKIYIVNEDGSRLTFIVREKKVYSLGGDTTEVFNKSDGRYLNLITCIGSWDYSIGGSSERLVVFTDLVI